MEDFLKSIAPDKLIDLNIGGDTAEHSKHRVSAQLLSQTSTVLASQLRVAQLKCETEAFGDRIALTYPRGRSEAWRLLLFWVYKKRLPDCLEWREDFQVMIDAWLLGDELEIAAFQDAIMLDFLKLHSDLDIEFLVQGCEQLRSGTALARFMAEEAVWATYREGVCNTSLEHLHQDGADADDLDFYMTHELETPDLIAVCQLNFECQQAQSRSERHSYALYDRFGAGRTEDRRWWMEFMVSTVALDLGVHGGIDGPVASSFKQETLCAAVNRVCEDEEPPYQWDGFEGASCDSEDSSSEDDQ